MENNKKLAELVKKVCDSLTDEQKEKIKDVKDVGELLKALGEMGIELPDELLEAVSGGQLPPSPVQIVLGLGEADALGKGSGSQGTSADAQDTAFDTLGTDNEAQGSKADPPVAGVLYL